MGHSNPIGLNLVGIGEEGKKFPEEERWLRQYINQESFSVSALDESSRINLYCHTHPWIAKRMEFLGIDFDDITS